MSTTYTWTITRMYTLQQPDPNYVVNVLWILTGVDGTTTASIGGGTTLDSNQSSTFIPYDQLTQEIVLGWVWAGLGDEAKAALEAKLTAKVEAQLNPTTAQGTPWNTQPNAIAA